MLTVLSLANSTWGTVGSWTCTATLSSLRREASRRIIREDGSRGLFSDGHDDHLHVSIFMGLQDTLQEPPYEFHGMQKIHENPWFPVKVFPQINLLDDYVLLYIHTRDAASLDCWLLSSSSLPTKKPKMAVGVLWWKVEFNYVTHELGDVERLCFHRGFAWVCYYTPSYIQCTWSWDDTGPI